MSSSNLVAITRIVNDTGDRLTKLPHLPWGVAAGDWLGAMTSPLMNFQLDCLVAIKASCRPLFP